jgi:hypothetical protein
MPIIPPDPVCGQCGRDSCRCETANALLLTALFSIVPIGVAALYFYLH